MIRPPIALLRRTGALLELQLRSAPLAAAMGLALIVGTGLAALGLRHPGGFDAGPGMARIPGELATRYWLPTAALLLVGLGGGALLEGSRRHGPLPPAGVSRWIDAASELLTGAVLLWACTPVLAIPFVWLHQLKALDAGTLERLALLLLGGAVVGALLAVLARRASRNFGLQMLLFVLGLIGVTTAAVAGGSG